MTDPSAEAPFFALREPVTPADPDQGFTERLRQRLTREILARPASTASPGGTMSQQTLPARKPASPPALTPYIMVADARRAIDWYATVFGGEQVGEPYVNADGTIGHAEVAIDDAVLMLAEPSDLWPEVPVRAPQAPATFSQSLHLQVADVDATIERARANGASVEREPGDQPYGRNAVIVDPFGHRWILLRPPAWMTRLRQGDLATVMMLTPDAGRARDFYAAVLQVPFFENHPGAWRTDAIQPPLAIRPAGPGPAQLRLSYCVDDIAAAVERIRAAGGQAGEPSRQPWGLVADCTDDQGTPFFVWSPAS